MAQAGNQELTEQFIQFYRNYYRDEIGTLAQRYPNEQRSLYVTYDDLYTFDPDLAEDLLDKPDQLREYAEEALRLYDLPADVSLGQAHVRIRALPDTVDIRNLRVHDNHVGRLIAVQGIVRKATDVRPKVVEAAFECQRCGTMTYIPQTDGSFQEPHECQGCERQGPFRVNLDQSEFVDAQKIRVQESPEGLRGGETPQSIDVNLEDDVTGEVTAGDHVTVVGVLHMEQQTQGNEKTPLFDLYMDGVSVTIEDEEFEDMEIDEDDVADIVELSERDDIYEAMVASVAPSIYGYEEEKLSMVLQLFSGVTKHLPDDTRIRGDLHMLLIGDPGTGKSQMLSYIQNIAPRSVYTSGKGSSSAGLCVTGDTRIHTENGFREIRALATDRHPKPVDEETSAASEIGVQTFDRESGEMREGQSSHVWRMPEKPCRRIETAHGKSLTASNNTPVLTCGENGIEWTTISDVEPGNHVAVPKYGTIDRSEVPTREFLELTTEKVDLADTSIEELRSALYDEFGHLRAAATELDLSEDFIYDSLRNRHVPLSKLDALLEAVGMTRDAVAFDHLMLRHGDSITIPETFDEDLMYLLGLVFGDGDIRLDRRDGNRGMVRLSNSDEAVLERAAEIFTEKFDKHPEIEYQDDRVPCIRVSSATIARLFTNVGMETPKVDLELAHELTTAEHADAFLRGLMDADGAVSVRDNGGSSILLSTISGPLAEQVQLMLETYGVRARRRERDRTGTYELDDGRTIESKHVQHFVEIYGSDIERYAERIGFEVEDKQSALEAITEDATRREETIPIGPALVATDGAGGDYHSNVTCGDNPGHERARAIIEDLDLGDLEECIREATSADLRWDRVVDATDVGKEEVFDLTVPGTHNFVGNGVVTHNTAAAVRDDFGDGQQWTLEAGALVLADKGVAAVDELDKMRCVMGDTLVHTTEDIKSIREIALTAAESGEIETLENGRTIRDLDLEVWTMTEDSRVVQRDVTAIHEYDAPNSLCEVTLESGESLTATADHPFFVLEDGERVEKDTAELDKGDWVYVPQSLSQPATDGGVATTTDATGPAVADSKLSPAHGAILGYIAGDGNVYYNRDEGSYGIRFTNVEEELLTDFERECTEAFGTTPVRHPSEQREDGVETSRLHGKEYVDELLAEGANLETYDQKCLPENVTSAARDTKAAFLRALADAEGTVDERSVKIFSSSYELLLGTKMLLLEFGVTSQIQTRERERGRDVHVLAITADGSLAAFRDQIGFTLNRKREALDAASERTTGDRTILDVIPDSGKLFADTRESLRLYQSECGLNDATYCNFETGEANISFRCAEIVLERFEERRQQAEVDAKSLDSHSSWRRLTEFKERYHVTQQELANGTSYTKQQISHWWGEDEDLRETVREQLYEIVGSISEAEFDHLSSLVRGNVKWRRVAQVEQVDPKIADDRLAILEQRLADVLGGGVKDAVERARTLLASEPEADTWDDLRAELDRHEISLQQIAERFDVAGSTVSRWFNREVDGEDFEAILDTSKELIEAKRDEIHELLDKYDERQYRRDQPKVYDLTVEGTHNFVANGMVVHNSEDRSAMHEALEQQKISVSKAGINATLKSRCSLLGAANPKYGRFDQYEPIGEQIDLEPALISRFDLIFTVTDQPDEEKDANLAEHILQTNYAGELNTQRTRLTNPNYSQEEVDDVTEEVAPEIEPELLRKYIAYSKRNCFPAMTEEAKESIRDFYVDLRSKGADEDAPVPVTARKLEALVRLAEASARVRLSDTVDQKDAQKVIEIVRSCLQDIGVDPETGEFDADVVETGTSKSQRDRIKGIKDVIREVDQEYEEEPGAPMDAIVELAQQEGMDRSKVEDELEKLRTKGDVYSPSGDQYKVV